MKILFMVAALAAALLLPGCLNDTPGDGLTEAKVEILNNRAYAPRVNELLNASGSSICVILYVMKYDGDSVDHAANRMIRSLASARERGVEVKVLLDHVTAESYPDTTNYLFRKGVAYRISPANVTTHAKLIVIDDSVTVAGSHNWTYSAASENNETGVVLHSRETALAEREYFNGLYDKTP